MASDDFNVNKICCVELYELGDIHVEMLDTVNCSFLVNLMWFVCMI